MKNLRILSVLILSLFTGRAFAAEYTVPTDNPVLLPFASFEIRDLEVIESRRHVQMTYSLPLELTGEKVTLVLTGERSLKKDGRFHLRGQYGRAVCAGTMCEVDYRDLPINRNAVAARVQEISQTPEEFDARLQLAMDFEGNPIGILNLKSSLVRPEPRR